MECVVDTVAGDRGGQAKGKVRGGAGGLDEKHMVLSYNTQRKTACEWPSPMKPACLVPSDRSSSTRVPAPDPSFGGIGDIFHLV